MKETSKNRHTVWLTDEAWKMVGDQYKGDNCSTQNEYIEKAIRFYVGYRNAECDGYYLPNTLSYMLEGSLTALGDRIGRLLFKLSVEEYMMMHIIAHDTDINLETLFKIRY